MRTILEDSDLTRKEFRSLSEELEEIVGCTLGHPPKPLTLMQTLVNAGSVFDKEDIILDFFSGSATTAHAIMQLNNKDNGNRRFIMVQLPEVCDESGEAYKAGYKNVCEIGKERIRRAGMKILNADDGQTTFKGDKPSVDIGFKVFKLDSSNLKLWDDTPVSEDDIEVLLDRMAGHIDGMKADRSNADLVYEILLKMGYPLTADLATFEVDGLTVYTVADNKMLIFLQPGITVEHIEKLVSVQPQKIVLAESSVTDNSVLSNAHYLLENHGIELKIV